MRAPRPREIDAPVPTTIRNERTKLTATWLNTAAGTSLAVGVLGPLAGAYFGYAGLAPLAFSTFTGGVLLWLVAALLLHAAARFILGELKP